MSIAYQCPSCLKTLYYEPGDSTFQTCHHCQGKIMVPSDTVHQAEMIDADPTDFSLREQRDLRLAEIQKELQAGNKIQAIAMFRETFGSGLREAKEAVEAMQLGRKPDMSRSALQQNYQALQEQQPQSIYPDTRAQAQDPGRIAMVILGALIALGIAIFIIFTSE
ncbi:MAG: hypothetical protein J5I65_06630 [Aridibacter famidurans]|nr:hypothetical protein [Aridibacter famidurans]